MKRLQLLVIMLFSIPMQLWSADTNQKLKSHSAKNRNYQYRVIEFWDGTTGWQHLIGRYTGAATAAVKDEHITAVTLPHAGRQTGANGSCACGRPLCIILRAHTKSGTVITADSAVHTHFADELKAKKG